MHARARQHCSLRLSYHKFELCLNEVWKSRTHLSPIALVVRGYPLIAIPRGCIGGNRIPRAVVLRNSNLSICCGGATGHSVAGTCGCLPIQDKPMRAA